MSKPRYRNPPGPFDTFEDAIRYRAAYRAAYEEREAAVLTGRTVNCDERARASLAKLPPDAGEPTRDGTRDGALGERPAW